MARWTITYSDQQHLSKIVKEMPIGGIAQITLLNNVVLEGVIRRINIGNNAGHGGWQYYGECELEDKNRQRWIIDYLDIRSATNIWNDTVADEYEKLGLISIIK